MSDKKYKGHIKEMRFWSFWQECFFFWEGGLYFILYFIYFISVHLSLLKKYGDSAVVKA